MISLQPINKKIRTALANKSKAVARDFSGLTNESKSELQLLQSTYSKAIWTKMFSPVNSTVKTIDDVGVPGSKEGLDTVTIMGGITDENGDLFQGFEGIYTGKGGTKEGILSEKTGAKSKRPIVGVKDISISYKGGLSAIREAQINWTCWTFEDLELLTPHFMAHGKGVLIEWGWSTPTVAQNLTVSKEDMVSGKAYSVLQDRIIDNSGDYDAMAGIISNWEWALRDDGGFDCTTTIVSRGVNILQGDTSGQGTKPTNENGEIEPSLKEFVGALRESLFSLCTTGGNWFDAPDSLPLSEVTATDWVQDKKQPPGVLVKIDDNWFGTIEGGPWLTWGFFEDNILSKWLGKVGGGEGVEPKPIASFRSIEPIITSVGSENSFVRGDGKGEFTDKAHQAKFRSVIIKNDYYLRTPSMKRWILPGQFPAQKIAVDALDFTDDYRDFVESIAGITESGTYFSPFAVNPNDPGQGGYLRNILISYDLIQSAFGDANTVREGMNALFDEFNKDLDGYWKFELVDDVHNPGNIKVMDMNKTATKPQDLLTDTQMQMDNPDRELFIFPSWGEKSIVKSQTLTSKIPSSMAVSAMYAGAADKDKKNEGANQAAVAVAVIAGQEAEDKSQYVHKMTQRLGKENPFGSKNPYGDIDNSKHFSSDGLESTAIPHGEKFGVNHGVAFGEIDRAAILEWYAAQEENKEIEQKDKAAADKRKKEIEDASNAEIAAGEKAIDNFKKVINEPNIEQVFIKARKYWWGNAEKFTLYNEEGDLNYAPGFNVIFRTTMVDFIQGKHDPPIVTEKQKEDATVDPMVPVELEITIDGTGGIVPGNCFHVDYIPENYKKYCIFQAISVDHSVGAENWTTTIKGQIRIAMNKLINDLAGK